MMRRAGSRVCGALAGRLQNKGLLQETLFYHPHHAAKPRFFCVPREGTLSTPPSAAFSSHRFLHSPLRSIAQRYLHILKKRPILTKSVTASTIFFLADITAQGISKYQSDDPQKVQWNTRSTLQMVASGFILSGPALHLWFNFASKRVPGRDLISTLKKMAMGQFIFSPTFAFVFFSLNQLMKDGSVRIGTHTWNVSFKSKSTSTEADDLQSISRRSLGETFVEVMLLLQRDFVPIISGLIYWPVCDFITYRYVPVHLQPLVSNSFFFVWTAYITYILHARGRLKAS